MGLFDDIIGTFRETNELAHGTRLKSDTFKTLELLHRAGPDVETQGLAQYLKLCDDIMARCHAWSRDGRLKAVAQLRAEARKNKDFDIGKAYGFYLASAFLECMVRESPDAKLTLVHLGVVAEEVRKQLKVQTNRTSSARRSPDIVVAADRTLVVVLAAVFWPVTDEKTTQDFASRLDELTVDGRIIIVSVAFGLLDGIARRAELDQAETLACMTVFLSVHLGYPEDSIPPILRDLMAHSSRPSTAKYKYISMGGEAAFAYGATGKVDSLVECGLEVRKLLDEILLW